MNITYLASPRMRLPSRSASSIHVMRMCEAFSLLGHNVKLIVAQNQDSNEKAILDYYGISSKFEIIPIELGKYKGKTFIFSVNQYFLAKRSGSDIIVTRSAQAAAISAVLGMRIIYDSHGPVWLNNKVDGFFYRVLKNNKNLLRMTTNSIALKGMYEMAAMLPHCGIVVAHNGSISKNFNDLPDCWPGRVNHMQIGYMGHLYPGRGVETIIESAKSLPEFDFHIVGGMQSDIEFWKNKVNLTNLFFHGFVHPSVVYKFRNRCDVLLAPYREHGVAVSGGVGDSSKYMNPIKLIEYMSSKKAIICSNLEILKEVLDDSTCLFAHPNRSDEWVGAILRLKDDGLRRKLGDSAYEVFNEQFTWERRALKMIENIV